MNGWKQVLNAWSGGLIFTLLVSGLLWVQLPARGAGRQTATVTRGPYLQLGTTTGTRLRWRTDVATDSRVRYGTVLNNLNLTADDASVTTEHGVTLTGLAPNTTYYYSVGTTAAALVGGDANHAFTTNPAVGSTPPLRVWVLGDAGWANATQLATRDAYYAFNGTQRTNLWLMLGDNAYNNGTDTEYQAGLFNVYQSMLRQSVLWPAIGNHDTAGSTTPPPTLPYFQIWDVPQQAEAGGVASGTNRYYSFNYANVHFVSLDAMTSPRTPPSAMLTWLQNDLAQNTQDWLIVFWHHPPYSKGTHDSDTETELIEMRQNVVPILENYGVDLVLCGHSHSYERSFLIDGHYGLSTTFTNAMKKSGGDGRPAGNGAYTKATRGPAAHEGAVYVVAGTAGVTGVPAQGPLNHPAMFTSQNNLGTLVLDINGNQLDAKFLRETGAIGDSFTILKGTGGNQQPAITTQPSDQTVCPGANVTFTAAASGTPAPTVQWQVSSDGVNYSNVAGATSATLNLFNVTAALNGQRYRAVFTNTAGSATTNAALLTVQATTTINTQPAAQSVCPGAPVSFTVAATGAGTLTYQWRKNSLNLPGATNNTFQIASASVNDTGAYDVVVTGVCGSVTSNSVSLALKTPVSFAAQPGAQSVCPGAPASFSVSANGTGPLSYQWRKNTVNITGANTDTYQIASASAADAGAYDVLVTGACGSVLSQTAALTLNSATNISAQPAAQNVCHGAPVTFAVTASGAGNLSYQWRKNGGALPNANGNTFTIATVTASDAGVYDVVVTGACGSLTSSSASLSVKTSVNIASQPIGQTVCAGAPVSFAVSTNGTGPLSYQWRKNGGNLAGATNNVFTLASTSANDAGVYDVVVTGACGNMISQTATLTVNSAPAVTTQPFAQSVCPGSTVTFTTAASGTPAPAVQWQVSSDGFNFSNIAGATSTVLTLNNASAAQDGTLYRAVFTNSCSTAVTNAVPFTVYSFTLAPAAQSFAASGGNGTVNVLTGGACAWTASSNAAWLSINNGATGNGAGAVSYTVAENNGPARTGTLTIAGLTFTVTQSDGCVFALNPTTANYPVNGGAGSVTINTNAGCAWTAASNDAWITLNGNTAGSGAGAVNYTVAANPGAARVGTLTIAGQTFTVTQALNCATQPITLSPATLPSGIAGTNYAQTLQASGGTAPYSFALSAGSLPPGLSLSSSGALSGTPSAAGAYTFTLNATAASGCVGTQTYTLSVVCPSITLTPATLSDATAGAGYQQSLTQTGGVGAIVWSVSVGQLPAGLMLATNGASGGTLSGTPTQPGAFSFTIAATDANGCTGTRPYTLQVNCPAITVNPATLPAATTGVSYSQTFTQSGGNGAFTYAWQGPLIPGLVFDAATQTLSGTPTQSGTFAFTVTTMLPNGCTGVRVYQLTVNCATISLAPATLPTSTAGVTYTQQLTATGGTAPYSFSVFNGALPAGLTLSTTGLLNGTPTTTGAHSFVVKAADANGCAGQQSYTLTVNCPALALAPAALANATAGVVFSQMLTVTGGAAPYTFNVVAGALPAGLALATNGVLSGTPTASGNALFTIRALDANGCAVERQYQLNIVCPAIVLNPASLLPGVQWAVYQQTLQGAGGSAPYSFNLESGALPPGVSLANSVLTGVPALPGNYSFVLRATDANGCSGTRAYTVTVQAKARKGDFDGDGKTDLAVWTPDTGNWMVLNSGNNQVQNIQWGAGFAPFDDVIVPGDYDGDGKMDEAIWRGADSIWYIRKSSDGQPILQLWGTSKAPYFDIPTPGDFDGDGKTDLAVWRRDGTWFVKRSSDGGFTIVTHGQTGDTPIPADYDGDGKTDFAVFRPNAIAPAPNWFILQSTTSTVVSFQWGAGYAPFFDVPVPADYDGDGKADLAIWRGADSIWYIRPSSNVNVPLLQLWGTSNAPYFDTPCPADYDGDGKADNAVWRKDGTWFVLRSSNNTNLIVTHGQNGDVPVPAKGVW